MARRNWISLASILLALSAAAPAAHAQELGIGYTRRSKHGTFSVSLGSALPTCPTRGGYGVRSPYGGYPVAGRYDTVKSKVWVPGYQRKVWIPARYETWIDACGTPRRRLVRAGHFEWIWEPGHYTVQSRRVWVPAPSSRSPIVPHY